jgi:hypothetical protein
MSTLLINTTTTFISSLIGLFLMSCACWLGILLNKDIFTIFICSVILGLAYINACYLFVSLFYL